MSYHYLKGIEESARVDANLFFFNKYGFLWIFIKPFLRNEFIKKQNKFFMEIHKRNKVKSEFVEWSKR